MRAHISLCWLQIIQSLSSWSSSLMVCSWPPGQQHAIQLHSVSCFWSSSEIVVQSVIFVVLWLFIILLPSNFNSCIISDIRFVFIPTIYPNQSIPQAFISVIISWSCNCQLFIVNRIALVIKDKYGQCENQHLIKCRQIWVVSKILN